MFEQAFGTDKVETKHEVESDFTTNDNFDETIKQMHVEAKQAETIGAAIDNAMDESQNPVTLGTAQETLHNMNVIGMDRLLKLRNSNQYTNESLAVIAMGAAVAAAVIVIVGLIIKYMEFMNEFVGGSKDKIESNRKNMKVTIEDFETRWKSKFHILAVNPSDQRADQFINDLKHEVSKITYGTDLILYQIIHSGKIKDEECKEYIKELEKPYELLVQLAEKTVDLKDELNKKIDDLKDDSKETEEPAKKEIHESNKKIIDECLELIKKFYHDNYRIYHEVFPATLINNTRKFFAHHDKVPTDKFPMGDKIDAKVLLEYYRKIYIGIKDSKDTIIGSSSSGAKLSFEQIVNGNVGYDANEDYTTELKELEKRIEETASKFEKFENEFKGSSNSMFKKLTSNIQGSKKVEVEYKEMFQYFSYITKTLAACVSINVKYIHGITIMHKQKESALILRTLYEESKNEPTLDHLRTRIEQVLK